jgi:hypothetical protein
MRARNKILGILLTAALVLALVAVPAYAATDFTAIEVGTVGSKDATINQSGTGWTWTVATTNTLTLTMALSCREV